jgi:hypothetical protein
MVDFHQLKINQNQTYLQLSNIVEIRRGNDISVATCQRILFISINTVLTDYKCELPFQTKNDTYD